MYFLGDEYQEDAAQGLVPRGGRIEELLQH